MWGEHLRFAHLWRTSFRTSRPLFARTRRGEEGGEEGGGGGRKGSPKWSVSEADSTNSGSSHARGPGIKQLIGTAVSISSLTSLKHEGKRYFLSSAPCPSVLSFFVRVLVLPPIILPLIVMTSLCEILPTFARLFHFCPFLEDCCRLSD